MEIQTLFCVRQDQMDEYCGSLYVLSRGKGANFENIHIKPHKLLTSQSAELCTVKIFERLCF